MPTNGGYCKVPHPNWTTACCQKEFYQKHSDQDLFFTNLHHYKAGLSIECLWDSPSTLKESEAAMARMMANPDESECLANSCVIVDCNGNLLLYVQYICRRWNTGWGKKTYNQ